MIGIRKTEPPSAYVYIEPRTKWRIFGFVEDWLQRRRDARALREYMKSTDVAWRASVVDEGGPFMVFDEEDSVDMAL